MHKELMHVRTMQLTTMCNSFNMLQTPIASCCMRTALVKLACYTWAANHCPSIYMACSKRPAPPERCALHCLPYWKETSTLR